MEPKSDPERPPTAGAVPARQGRDRSAEIDLQRKLRPNIYWYLTFRCNLACAHCWVHSSPQVDTAGELTTAEAMCVIQQMVELGVQGCNLSGGEILTRRDALEIVQALADSGIQVVVETNGLGITAGFLELAGRLQRGRLRIGISLDGGTAQAHERLRGPRTFQPTVRNLYRLKQAGVGFSVQCTLNRSNVDTIPALYDLAADLHPALRCLGFCLLNPLGRGDDLARELGVGFRDLDRILTLIQEHKHRFPGLTMIKAPPAAIPPAHLAMAIKDSLVSTLVSCQFPLLGILPHGEVTICALCRDDADLCFGNVRTSSLRQIWEEARMDSLRARYLAAESLEGICGDCIWKYSCRGGCRAWAFEQGRSFDAPYPLCAALAAAGEFPDAYRISVQRAFLNDRRGAPGCRDRGTEARAAR
jgi:radical SAM protein with 4Fe4S-binding SPASM domain